jgi:hypothetical protein
MPRSIMLGDIPPVLGLKKKAQGQIYLFISNNDRMTTIQVMGI